MKEIQGGTFGWQSRIRPLAVALFGGQANRSSFRWRSSTVGR
jgi:hypothetical protein